jgi:hypothetical protein
MEVTTELQAPVALTPFHRKLGGLQSRRGQYEIEKSLLPNPGIEPLSSKPVARHYTDWAIPDPTHYICFEKEGWKFTLCTNSCICILIKISF